jgi:hypothetical protein
MCSRASLCSTAAKPLLRVRPLAAGFYTNSHRASSSGHRLGDTDGTRTPVRKPARQAAPEKAASSRRTPKRAAPAPGTNGAYPTGSVNDSAGPGSGSFRVNRGGSWNSNARNCRSAPPGLVAGRGSGRRRFGRGSSSSLPSRPIPHRQVRRDSAPPVANRLLCGCRFWVFGFRLPIVLVVLLVLVLVLVLVYACVHVRDYP